MIIYVRHEHPMFGETMSPEQTLAYLFGMSGIRPLTVDTAMGPSVKLDMDTVASAGTGERYLIELDGKRTEIQATWVIPFIRGMATRHGDTDLMSELSQLASGRRQRMQALMTGHRQGWLTYIEIIEGKRP